MKFSLPSGWPLQERSPEITAKPLVLPGSLRPSALHFLLMRLCAITDRLLLGPVGVEPEQDRRRLLRDLLRSWFEGGVDIVQIREKDLAWPVLRLFSEEVLAGLDRRSSKVLINLQPPRGAGSPTENQALDALTALSDGFHLPGRLSPADVEWARAAFRRHGREALVSLSCHSVADIVAARHAGADLVLYGPVFEKRFREKGSGETSPGTAGAGQGLSALRAACEAAEAMPVFALGGVHSANTGACIAQGAAGIAGIRLFLEDDWHSFKGPAGIPRALR